MTSNTIVKDIHVVWIVYIAKSILLLLMLEHFANNFNSFTGKIYIFFINRVARKLKVVLMHYLNFQVQKRNEKLFSKAFCAS